MLGSRSNRLHITFSRTSNGIRERPRFAYSSISEQNNSLAIRQGNDCSQQMLLSIAVDGLHTYILLLLRPISATAG